MPPNLGRIFEPDWAGRPAHMSPRDWQLWARYRDQLLTEPVRLYFDVALGEPPHQDSQGHDPAQRMWNRLTAHRADVVIERPNDWTILELRSNAGPGALGALLTYAALWRADPPDARTLNLHLVTDTIADPLRPIFAAYTIAISEV